MCLLYKRDITMENSCVHYITHGKSCALICNFLLWGSGARGLLLASSNEVICSSLRWPHNGHDCVSNHQPHDCLLNRLFRHRSKKISKPRVTGLCAGNSPGTGEFPAQRASYAENVSIWWRHHELELTLLSVHGNMFSSLYHTQMILLYASARCEQPSGEYFLPRIGSLLCQVWDIIHIYSRYM